MSGRGRGDRGQIRLFTPQFIDGCAFSLRRGYGLAGGGRKRRLSSNPANGLAATRDSRIAFSRMSFGTPPGIRDSGSQRAKTVGTAPSVAGSCQGHFFGFAFFTADFFARFFALLPRSRTL